MNFIAKNIRTLRNQYLLFIVTIILTILSTQVIIQFDLNQQNEDAHLINLAGRQRMLSQRISKLVLYIQDDIKEVNQINLAHLDTLEKIVLHWQEVHFSLLRGSEKFKLSDQKSPSIDSLLTASTPLLTNIVNACKKLAQQPDSAMVNMVVKSISDNELKFLNTMEKTVNTYQQEAETKLNNLKKIELVLAIISIIILLLELTFIFRPMVNGLKVNNTHLTKLNRELNSANNELHTTGEELRNNLDYVNSLKYEIELKGKQYHDVVENAHDMIYELDETGKFSYVNPIISRMAEYPKEEFLQKKYWDIIHPNHIESSIEFYKKQRNALQEYSYNELPIISSTGKTIWIGQNVRMFFKSSWVYKVSVIARDITTLKETQKKLEESEKLYRELSENSLDITALNNQEGIYTYVSSSVSKVLGYTPEELLNTSAYTLIHPEDIKPYKQALNNVLSEKTVQNIEYRVKRKNAQYIWMDSLIQPIVDKNQITANSYQTTSRNITLRKEFECELQKAKVVAEEATKSKSQFLSMMSHEIRTPMNAIIGLTDLMLQENPRVDQEESLKLLKFSGENLLTIINDVLDFSKIEAGKIMLEHIDFDLHALLKNLVLMLEQRAQDKGIQLQFNYDKNIPDIVKGDPVRIAQVVTNLIGNAIKFTEKGFVRVQITLLGMENHLHNVHISVHDSGIGIKEEQIKTIFENFSQAAADTTRKFGGTGLGLSITKRLLDLMNSKIHVESEPDRGSTFSFSLLMEEGKLEDTKKSQPLSLTKDFKKHAIKILLVEDNRVNQIVASNFLKKWGIEVEIANHGKEAVELVRKKIYQLILMDLQMPEMDGYEASQQIRTLNDDDPYFKNVPIIALTASAMVEIKDKVLKAGMNDFVSKPFQPEELHSKIGKYVLHNVEEDEKKRPLNLDLYAAGNNEFKRELAGSLIKNIEELQLAFHTSVQQTQAESYMKSYLKVKHTIKMLGDEEFYTLTEEIKNLLTENPEATKTLAEKLQLFDVLSKQLIEGLEEEIQTV
jgi:PAS domain S-box-containing protein